MTKNLLFFIAIAFIGFSCTNAPERFAARIEFEVHPEKIDPDAPTYTEEPYRELAELVYSDSVIIPALRDVGIQVSGQNIKAWMDSILVTKARHQYNYELHDLVVWQNDQDRALNLVQALYTRLVDYYQRNKKTSENGTVATNEEIEETEEVDMTNIQELSNQLENVERRIERWSSNPDSLQYLEELKANILAKYAGSVEQQTMTDATVDNVDGSPYAIYIGAEKLGMMRMPAKKRGG